MQIELTAEAQAHLVYWKKIGNKSILNKIEKLTDAILENPFTGIGKPEALKHELAPKWSRRINGEHRYVYLATEQTLFVYSLKGHYA
ncbi:MAG: Txe/YoeB family addiction module toxin [Sphingobacteriaceae bacterium]|nr:Txe/YoeB family addiction module toxin [Sphingobacteriaceae bacterium]